MYKEQTASIVLAAGRGSRMEGFNGSKTLLPLIPKASIYEGEQPILRYILGQLPPGPKGIIVHHCKEEVQTCTRCGVNSYIEQPILNGTGGALLAAHRFIERTSCANVLVTMGDVPLVTPRTYRALIGALAHQSMVVLGFTPEDKKKYGVLETDGGNVLKITEWKIWKDYPAKRREALNICNAGIYAFTRALLLQYLQRLAEAPQKVEKMIDGRVQIIKEYFITDIVGYLTSDGYSVGYQMAADPNETLGVDDPDALRLAQALYARRHLAEAPCER